MLTPIPNPRNPRGRLLLLLLPLLLAEPVAAASQLDYLKQLEQEATKIDAQGGGEATGGAAAVEQRRTGRGFSAGLTMEAFGTELGERYRGSAIFYGKLSRRYQEQVYAEYLDGASIDEVRALITELYLRR